MSRLPKTALATLFVILLTALAVAVAQDNAADPPADGVAPAVSADAAAGAQADTAGQAKFNSCVECHNKMGGEYAAEVQQFQASVHAEMELVCTDCHGGDSSSMDILKAKSPAAGFIGRPGHAQILTVCSRCHSNAGYMKRFGNLRTDQLELYKTSIHGQAVLTRNDQNAAVCTDCHTAHHILRVKNPEASVAKKNLPDTCGRCHGDAKLMAQYGLDPQIPEQYKGSEHGKRLFEHDDIAAPVCNDCHGNHGAVPPGIGNIADVCGNCHLKTEKYYNNSAHAPAFAALGLKKCLVCHNQHALQKPTDDYFNEGSEGNCVTCHADGTEHHDDIVAMRETITNIRGMHERADVLVEETEHTTHLSMHEMIPQVEQVRTHLLTARILQHGTSLKEMQDNEAAAKGEFDKIEAFTEKLLERSAFNKMMVMLLAAFLVGFGLLLWAYRKFVLDFTSPWQPYEG